jgi:hypothetical protein
MTILADTAFATGGGVVKNIDENTILLDRDLRDSTGDRWYWHVRLRSPTTTTVRVQMARPGILGRFGPATSAGAHERTAGSPTCSEVVDRVWQTLDTVSEVVDYSWPGRDGAAPDGHFDVGLRGGQPTLLCATIPYGPRELHCFRRRLGDHASWHSLAHSEAGRVVPLVRVPGSAARRILVLTARHHACEAMASYVLEGAVLEFLDLRKNGHLVARSTELVALPMMDIDGVCAGDQGKARVPWDHNRDYGSGCRYRSVEALRSLMQWEDRLTFALDLHTPGLRGRAEERPYIVASGDPGDIDDAYQLLAGLESVNASAVHCDPPGILVFDGAWNSAHSSSARCCAAWLRSRPSTRIALTIEYPNAVDRGTPVFPCDARRFGGHLLRSLLALM